MDPHQSLALLLSRHAGRSSVRGEMSAELSGANQPPREGQDGTARPCLLLPGRACSQVRLADVSSFKWGWSFTERSECKLWVEG